MKNKISTLTYYKLNTETGKRDKIYLKEVPAIHDCFGCYLQDLSVIECLNIGCENADSVLLFEENKKNSIFVEIGD